MRPTLPRTTLALALLGSACLLAACGMDPPPAPGEQKPAAATEAPEPAGAVPSPRAELVAATANGSAARCNIETIDGQTLEAVHPTIAAGNAVKVQGWYALSSTPASAASPAAAGNAVDDAAAAAPATTQAPSAGPVLVIANENAINHWVVPLPALAERRDVAQAFGDPALAMSGFEIELDLSGLRPGFYGIHVSDAAHSAESVCGLGRGFVIQ